MARRRIGRLAPRPGARIVGTALAIFLIGCGVVVLVAGGFGHAGKSRPPAAVEKLHRAASKLGSASSTASRALAEVEGARNALEATDYGQARLSLQKAQDGLTDLRARLDEVRTALQQLANSPKASQLPAEVAP